MNAPIPFNDRARFISGVEMTLFLIVFFPSVLWSQLLPPDSVDLSKVSIPETESSTDLCPVHWVASDESLPIFRHNGIEYRGHLKSCRFEFQESPNDFAMKAAARRWENNFCRAMSRVWCPITDQINPGGWKSWYRLDLKWESCCQFCNVDIFPGCFDIALKRLKKRAAKAFEVTGGRYVEGIEDPIRGALKTTLRLDSDSNEKPAGPGAVTVPPKLLQSNAVVTDSRFDRAYGEWRHYGGDRAHSRYSPLNQIDAQTVEQLEIAWRWESPDAAISARNPEWRVSSFKATPLMVGGVLFTSTGLSQVAAVNAGTGETIWVYDPQSYRNGRPANSGFQHRGVEYWSDGKDSRILIATGGKQLIAINAVTGKPYADFGVNGMVDLTKGLERKFDPSQLGFNSPPVVCRDTIVVGSVVFDFPNFPTTPPGFVRGYDVRTGKMKWVFRTIPQPGEFGNETWKNNSWKTTGNVNVWSSMSADEDLGFVYLPIGTPTNDYYGGHRHGNNLFADSLVCLNAETGERVWHFQAVHHGLWDYDFPCGPNLLDITVKGQKIKAVAQVSKQGFCYVFDRVTGIPVWPIEERPVMQTDVPGEYSSSTQPFPSKPPAFERQTVFENDLIDFTSELRKEAKEILAQYEHGPMFLPPRVVGADGKKGSLVLPSAGGGANWSGAAADPETGILYVPSRTRPQNFSLKKGDPDKTGFHYNIYNLFSSGVTGPRGLPLVKPPYQRITAMDLNRGVHVWQVPHGEGPRNHPAIRHLNLGPLGSTSGLALYKGGGILTKELYFIILAKDDPMVSGATADTGYLHAFDKTDGALVWEFELDTMPHGTPMTYLHEGRQYIVLGVGGGRQKSELIAFAIGKR